MHLTSLEHILKPISTTLPPFEKFKSGFDSKDENGSKLDKFHRNKDGSKLSELIERIDQPLVIAFDGAWGSGKSFFLRCWANEHNKSSYPHIARILYFDALSTDYFDDPLIALTSAISEELEKTPETNAAKAWKMAKSAAPFLGKAAIRLGTAAIVGKAISISAEDDGSANEMAESLAIESGELTKSLAAFWTKEDGKRAAMQHFKAALSKITHADETEEVSQKLVIVVDELDRCRPDYALELLEIIKHFFKVPGVHFVLGVNLKELQNSVRVRYGSQISADKYLQKFYDVVFRLSESNLRGSGETHAENYFSQLTNQSELTNANYRDALQDYIQLASKTGNIQLRDVERIISCARLTQPIANERDVLAWRAVAGLIVVSILRPDWIEKIAIKRLDFHDFTEVFPVLNKDADIYELDQIREIWRWMLSSGAPIREALVTVGLVHEGKIAPDREKCIRMWINEYLWEVSNPS